MYFGAPPHLFPCETSNRINIFTTEEVFMGAAFIEASVYFRLYVFTVTFKSILLAVVNLVQRNSSTVFCVPYDEKTYYSTLSPRT